MRRLMPMMVAVAVVMLVGGCADPGPEIPEGMQRISGTVTVTDRPCAGNSSQPRPVNGGTPVVVEDAEGEIVARSTLSVGESPPDAGLRQCIFPFVVEGVPEGSTLYTVRIGADARLVEQFSPDELAAPIRFVV